jgi:hypothetical protein
LISGFRPLVDEKFIDGACHVHRERHTAYQKATRARGKLPSAAPVYSTSDRGLSTVD